MGARIRSLQQDFTDLGTPDLSDEETETKGMTYKWWAMLTVSIGSFMVALDISIVNVCFPRLAGVFETDSSIVAWVAIAYTMVGLSLMLTLGRIGDVQGRKRVYVLGLALYTAALAGCSLSQSIPQLIVARAVQGAGGAMATAMSAAIITAIFPSQERGKALGIVGAALSTGLVIGPVLGGLILDTLNWQAIFYTRVPVSVVALVMAWKILKEQKDAAARLQFDLGGAITLFAGFSCLLLFLNLGGKWGFFSIPTLALVSITVISLALFIVLERRAAQPIVDLNVFQNRVFTAANISAGIQSGVTVAAVFLVPFYLIDALSYSASVVGLLLAVVALPASVLAPISGWLSDRVGSRVLATVGIATICLALFLLSELDTESSTMDIALRLAALGAGMGIFLSPNYSRIMGSISSNKLGTASAMTQTMRLLGSSSGLAISGAIFASRKLLYITKLTNNGSNLAYINRLSVVGAYHDAVILAAIFCVIGIATSVFPWKRHLESENSAPG